MSGRVRSLGIGLGLGAIGVWLSWGIWSEIWRLASESQTLSYILATPLLAIWLVWVRRKRLAELPLEFTWLGPLLIAAGLGLFKLSAPLHIDSFWFASGLLVVLGAITAALGWRIVVALIPVWIVMGFVIPVPGSLSNALAQPLMSVSAMVTADSLRILGVNVKLSGNLLNVNGHPLNVAQACSGLRSFFTLALLVSTFVFLKPFRWWVRVVLLCLSPVVAIAANLVRLLITAALTADVGQESAEVFHDVGGFVTFGLGVIACLGIIRALEWARLKTVSGDWSMPRPPAADSRPAGQAPGGQPPGHPARRRSSASAHRRAKAFDRHGLTVILGSCLLLGLFGASAAYPYLGEGLADYHQRVRDAVLAIPTELDHWTGTETELPAAAVTMLQPNVARNIRYTDTRTGRGFTFSLIHCGHARDMSYHTPPVCYPNSGWRIVDVSNVDWSVNGHPLPGREYAMRRMDEGQGLRQIVVANFYVLPDGRFARDRKSAIGAGRMPWQYDPWGVAQVQLIFSRAWTADRREKIIRTMLERNWSVFDVIRDGLGQGG